MASKRNSAGRLARNPGHYGRRLLQEMEFRTGWPCSKPSEIWLKLTERCNCRCRMCTIWQKNRSREGELSRQDWESVLSGLRSWLGTRHIWLTGGEPLLRPDCLDLIHHASSVGLSTGIITNGILLSTARREALLQSGLNEFHVSLDSLRPEIHDHLRGVKGAHERAKDNVLALKVGAERSGISMKIVIKTIIMGFNHHEILPLVDWVQEQGFDEIKFQPLESDLEAEDNPAWFRGSPYWHSMEGLDAFLEMLAGLAARKEAGSPIHNSLEELKGFAEYFVDPEAAYEQAKNHTFTAGRSTRCRSGCSWMEILSRGGLRMCRYMPPVGDIRRASSPRQFWRSRFRCWEDVERYCYALHRPD